MDADRAGWGSRRRESRYRVFPTTSPQSVAELEAEVAQFQEALAGWQHLGVMTGVLAERFGVTSGEGWAFLVRLSQHTDTRVRPISVDQLHRPAHRARYHRLGRAAAATALITPSLRP